MSADFVSDAWAHKMPNGLPTMVPMLPLINEGSSLLSKIKNLKASTVYVLAKDFIYIRDNGEAILIPEGFCTDFGSTPRILWPLGLEPTGILLTCSLIHDFGYRHDFYITPSMQKIHKSTGKRFHDRLFKEIFEEVNHMKVMPGLSYFGLTLFGWFAWNMNGKYRNNKLCLTGEYERLFQAQRFKYIKIDIQEGDLHE